MTIETYSDLKTSVANWIARDDLTSVIPDFIALAESRIYRKLRIRAMEASLSETIASGVIALPTGYVEMKHSYVEGNQAEFLTRQTEEYIYANYPQRTAGGLPKFIAREGGNIIFGPFPDSDYTIKGIYYQRLTALSDTNTTNWFTTNAPDLLLFGALVEAADYQDDEKKAKWEGRFMQILKDIQDEDDQEASSGSQITMAG